MTLVPRRWLACLIASAAACSGSSTMPTTSTSQSAPPLPAGSRLEVQPPFILFVNDTDRVRAVTFVPFQAVDVSSDAQWQSSNPTVATVAAGGQLVARSAGTTQLSAQYRTLSASAPLTVSTDADVQSVTILSCGGPVLVGFEQDCAATVRVASSPLDVNFADRAVWATSDASIVAVSPIGHVTVRGPGQARVSATIHGKTGTASFDSTRAQRDALSDTGGSLAGQLRPGNSVTIGMELVYSVVSAATGTLTMRVSDQDGQIAASPERVVANGSSRVFVEVPFTIPRSSTRLCWFASLVVGVTTVTAPANAPNCAPLTP